MAKAKTAIVEDNPDLVRVLSTNAIINNSDKAYEARLSQIAKSKRDEKQSEDIIQLKEEVQEIKKLLKKIASKKRRETKLEY
jgi:patatin-like phospholipase/acyl hydrolase